MTIYLFGKMKKKDEQHQSLKYVGTGDNVYSII